MLIEVENMGKSNMYTYTIYKYLLVHVHDAKEIFEWLRAILFSFILSLFITYCPRSYAESIDLLGSLKLAW